LSVKIQLFQKKNLEKSGGFVLAKKQEWKPDFEKDKKAVCDSFFYKSSDKELYYKNK